MVYSHCNVLLPARQTYSSILFPIHCHFSWSSIFWPWDQCPPLGPSRNLLDIDLGFSQRSRISESSGVHTPPPTKAKSRPSGWLGDPHPGRTAEGSALGQNRADPKARHLRWAGGLWVVSTALLLCVSCLHQRTVAVSQVRDYITKCACLQGHGQSRDQE